MGERKIKAGWKRSEPETREALDHQVSFLRSSSRAYDAGALYEAARIGAAAHIILQDGRQTSLLTQLGLRTKTKFLSQTAPDQTWNLATYMPLIGIRCFSPGRGVPPTITYVPAFDNPKAEDKLLEFDQWWDKETIFDDRKGNVLTRKRLISSLRDQDGGGHLDAVLSDPAYVAVSRENAAGWQIGLPHEAGTPLPPGAHYAMMRIIAWELERTLVESGVVEGPIATGAPA